MSSRVQTRSGPLDAGQVARVRALADAAERHDGVEPLGEQTLLDLAEPGATHVLAAPDQDGDLVGYGQLGPERGGVRTAELVVAPGARGAGLGRALLSALLDGAEPRSGVRLWAHGSLPASAALARHAGLVPVRALHRMARPLTDADLAPTAALPPGTRLRAFDPATDAEAWLALNAAAFAHHPEQGTMTRADLDARTAEPWFSAEDLLLAETETTVETGAGASGDAPAARLVGFAWTKVTPPIGELYVLGVAPDQQGAGLGRGLTRAALAHLRSRGTDRAVLFCDADNVPAVRTYAATGFQVDRTDTQWAPV